MPQSMVAVCGHLLGCPTGLRWPAGFCSRVVISVLLLLLLTFVSCSDPVAAFPAIKSAILNTFSQYEKMSEREIQLDRWAQPAHCTTGQQRAGSALQCRRSISSWQRQLDSSCMCMASWLVMCPTSMRLHCMAQQVVQLYMRCVVNVARTSCH